MASYQVFDLWLSSFFKKAIASRFKVFHFLFFLSNLSINTLHLCISTQFFRLEVFVCTYNTSFCFLGELFIAPPLYIPNFFPLAEPDEG